MLYLISFALFVMGVFIFVLAPQNLIDNFIMIAGAVILFIAILLDPNFGEYTVIQQLFMTGSRVALFLAPLIMIILGVGMISFAIRLYRIENNRLQLMIGCMLGILLIALLAVPYYLLAFFPGTAYEDWITLPSFVMAYFVLLFINYLLVTLRLSLLEDEAKKEFVIVLGAQLNADGKLNRDLTSRLDMALRYVERQQYLHRKMPTVIVTGAQTIEHIASSEAKQMAEYLIAHGLDKNHIILEEEAQNTHDNFRYTKALIQAKGYIMETTPAAFVTNNYHLYRGHLYANMEGWYHIAGIGAKTPFLDHLFGVFREYIAILFMHRKLHFLMTILLIAVGIIHVIYFS